MATVTFPVHTETRPRLETGEACPRIETGEACWTIEPLETPRVLRRCTRCDVVCTFRSSDRFRTNAHQRRVDVWLIYRCTACDESWKSTIFTRVLPEEIGDDLFQRFQESDLETAWRYAFDLARLERQGCRVETSVPVRVVRSGAAIEPGQTVEAGQVTSIRIVIDRPCAIRLDQLLASELGVSRSALDRAVACGLLRVVPEQSRVLRRPAQDGQRIEIAAAFFGTQARSA